LFAAAICAGFTADATAASSNWVSTSAATWNAANTTVWNGGIVPGSANGNTNADTATFNLSTGVLVTTSTNWNIDNITFSGAAGAYNIGSNLLVLSAGGAITDSSTSTSTQTITAPLTLAGAYNASISTNASNLTLSGATTGSSTFNFSGGAATNNSYGAISVGSLTAFTGTLNILTSGYDKVANITAADTSTSQIINIGNSNTSGATFFNSQSIGSGVSINIYGAGSSENLGALRAESGTIAAAITLETSNASIGANSGTSTISGNIGGAGNLTKDGGGTVILSGTNTWLGGTTSINAGTLQINTARSLPASSIVAFTNTTGAATLNIQGQTPTLTNLTFGTQTTGTNTVTIAGTAGAALTVSPATLTFAPENTADVLAVTMASLSSFTYNNPTGTFAVNNGTQSGSNGTSTLTLPTTAGSTASIIALTLNVANIGGQSSGGATSTLNLSNATTIYADNINLGASASRSIGNIQFPSTLTGPETLKIRGHDGVSAANLLIGNTNSFANDTTSYGGMFNAAGNASKPATLDALFGTMTLGEAGANGTSGRQAGSSGSFIMGAGTLTATTASLGTVFGTGTADTWTATGVLNIGAGTANITTINMGVDSAVSGQTAVTLNATVNLNTGSTLNATTIQLGSVTSGQTVTRNAAINWNAGTIGNIATGNLNVSGASIVLAGTAATHTFNISSAQVGNISSVISGTGPLTVNSAGTVNLSAANTFTGNTTLIAGTLLASASNTLSPNSAINISGGTLDVSGFVNTIPGLTVASGGNLNLGLGNVLTVNGTAGLAGTLNLSGSAGTLPEILMTYSSETGTFAAANGIPSGDTLSYTGTQLLLVGSSTQSNLTWNNLGGSGDGTTWDIANNQNWNNGTAAAVYHEGDIVTFNDTDNNHYAVTLNTVVHPSSVTVSTAGAYTVSGTGGIANVASGTTPLTLTGTGSLTLGGSNTYTGGTTVGTGTDTPKLILTASNSLPVASVLKINTGSTVQIAGHTGGASNIVITTVGSLTNNGLIDVTNNDLIVRGSTLWAITTEITSGYAGGTWNGTPGITSSTAAGNFLTAVGVLLNDHAGSAIYSTFDGASTLDGDVLVKYTYYGDANLDGAVDGSDYTKIDAGFTSGGTLTGWQNGDFNYDGKIDGSDYTLIDNAFNTQGSTLGSNPAALIATSTAQFAGGSSAVPEPTTLGLLGIGAASLLARRRRR
jgi:autotransporter-associated beta strand protein